MPNLISETVFCSGINYPYFCLYSSAWSFHCFTSSLISCCIASCALIPCVLVDLSFDALEDVNADASDCALF